MGETLDLPAVDDAAILEFYVVEKDGAIIGGMYLEKSVRQCHFGLSPEATAALLPIQDQVLASSKEAGVRFIHCQIPRNLPLFEQVSRHLEKAGYGRRDDLVDHMIDLRP